MSFLYNFWWVISNQNLCLLVNFFKAKEMSTVEDGKLLHYSVDNYHYNSLDT